MSQALIFARYDTHTLNPGLAMYSVFAPEAVGTGKPLCVFSVVKRSSRTRYEHVNAIMRLASARMGTPWHTMHYAEFVTHQGYPMSTGYFGFRMFDMHDPEPNTSFVPRDAAYSSVEMACPLVVYDTFRLLARQLPDPESYVSRENPAYKFAPASHLRAEVLRIRTLRTHVAAAMERTRKIFGPHIRSPAQARRAGYRYDPHRDRTFVLTKETIQHGMWVDMQDSHLLCQYACMKPTPDEKGPEPFALWDMCDA